MRVKISDIPVVPRTCGNCLQPIRPAAKHTGASAFLHRAADLMAERGKQYDQPDGERSMAKTVEAFYNITGKRLTEAEGWLFMQILKDVRQWQKPTYHADSAEDCVAYSALKAEALERESMKCSTHSGTTDSTTGES